MIPALLALVLTCDPGLAARFTPVHAGIGVYQACATPMSINELLADNAVLSRGDRFTYTPEELLEPLDAFGRAGSYDPAALVRLYTGRRVRVVRGWLERNGRIESRTLLSPYPDSTMSRLNPGTLVITWRHR